MPKQTLLPEPASIKGTLLSPTSLTHDAKAKILVYLQENVQFMETKHSEISMGLALKIQTRACDMEHQVLHITSSHGTHKLHCCLKTKQASIGSRSNAAPFLLRRSGSDSGVH